MRHEVACSIMRQQAEILEMLCTESDLDDKCRTKLRKMSQRLHALSCRDADEGETEVAVRSPNRRRRNPVTPLRRSRKRLAVSKKKDLARGARRVKTRSMTQQKRGRSDRAQQVEENEDGEEDYYSSD